MIDLSGRGTTRAEDAQGTPTQSHISPSIPVYEDIIRFRAKTCAWVSGVGLREQGDGFTVEGCSGSEAGSYLRLIDFVYHSTLGLRVIKKKRRRLKSYGAGWRYYAWGWFQSATLFRARELICRREYYSLNIRRGATFVFGPWPYWTSICWLMTQFQMLTYEPQDAVDPGRLHSVDFEPFIESQLARTQTTLGSCVVQLWSRPPHNLGVPKPLESIEWYLFVPPKICVQRDHNCIKNGVKVNFPGQVDFLKEGCSPLCGYVQFSI